MGLTADQLLDRIRAKLPARRRDCFQDDEQLIDTMVNLLNSLDGSRTYEMDHCDELIFDESEEDSTYTPVEEQCNISGDFFSNDYMQRVIDYVDQGHSFRSVSHTFRRVKHSRYISRFRDYLANAGTTREKFALVTEFTWNKFKSARELGVAIHDREIRRWAIEKATEVGLEGFICSEPWIRRFKQKNAIVSRKITKFVTRKYTDEQEEIENNGAAFLLDFSDNIMPHFATSEIINSDQSGFQYEMHSSRTLSFRGERNTVCQIGSARATTHSYTIQPMINMQGRLAPHFMIVLQEVNGEFGPRVRESLPHIPGLFLTCTRSGKVEKQTLIEWRDRCLVPSIGNKACLILDSLTNQRDAQMFQVEGKSITLKTLPPGSTSFLQPLDVYFFRQWKDFYRRFTERILLDGLDIVLHERRNIIRMQTLIWNQLRAPVFYDFIKYAWKKAGYPVDMDSFVHPAVILFNVEGKKCDPECGKSAFIMCGHCKKTLCCNHFLTLPHAHF